MKGSLAVLLAAALCFGCSGPRDCSDAIDHADLLVEAYGVKADISADAFRAANNSDYAALVTANEQLTIINGAIETISVDYEAAKKACGQ